VPDTCPRCRQAVRAGARFCTGCGGVLDPSGPVPAPGRPATGPHYRLALVTFGVAVVVVGSVLAAVLLLRPGGAAGAPGATAPATAAAAPPQTSAAAPGPDSGPVRPTDPGTALSQERAEDAAAADSLVGLWIPQVSAKAAGRAVNGVTYDDGLIWTEFQSYRAAYPDALLVRSSDYTSFRVPGYWVVVIGRAFATADAANAWCAQQSYGPDDCFAKRLSHTSGPAGNTGPRG
jgi:hypothetical protein